MELASSLPGRGDHQELQQTEKRLRRVPLLQPRHCGVAGRQPHVGGPPLPPLGRAGQHHGGPLRQPLLPRGQSGPPVTPTAQR